MSRTKKFFTVLEHSFVEESKSYEALFHACCVSAANGADGLFVVFYGIKQGWLAPLLMRVREAVEVRFNRTFLLGVNCLGNHFGTLSWARENGVDAVWTDSIFTPGFQLVVPPGWESPHPWYGGVEFKYQPPHPAGLEHAIREAQQTPVIVTTSGEATGSAPPVEKLRRFRELMGEGPELAVASGVDVHNVVEFLPWADTFIVRTSLETEGVLDGSKILRLAKLIHE